MFAEYFDYVLREMQQTGMRIATALPGILTALAVIVATLLVGRLVRSLTTKLLRLVGVNVLSRRAGFDRFLKPTELATGMAELVGVLVYWLLLFLGITYALGLVGFESAERLLASFALHLPRIFVSIVILVIGVHVAAFLGDLSRRAAQGAGLSYAAWIGRGVKVVVLLITIVTIVEELAVSLDFLKVFLYIVLGGLGVVLAIALGVGGIEVGRDLVTSMILRRTVRAGDRLLWKEEAVTVDEVGPVFTRLHADGRVVHARNSELMSEITVLPGGDAADAQEGVPDN